MTRRLVRLVSRDHCHLCDEAESVVRSAVDRFGVRMQVLDVDADPELHALYSTRIPVLLDARDRVLAEGHIGRRVASLAIARARFAR